MIDFAGLFEQRPIGRRRFVFWFCALLLFICVPLYGIDREHKLSDLYHTAWTFKDGAPSEIYALAQTTDGYLWLGTATGLFRFDGIKFESYKPQTEKAFLQRSVASLFATPDGGLWVGYWYGGVSFIKDGTVANYGIQEGLPSHAVLAFARDRQGAIWIAAGSEGLARLEGSRWRKIGTDWGFEGEADTVFVDQAGTVWVGTPTTVEFLKEGSHHFQIAARDLLPIVQSFAQAPNGKLWMAEGGYGVRPVPLSERDNGKLGPAILVGAPAITFDDQGSLWITTAGNGVRRVPYPERLHAPRIKGPNAWQFHNAEVEAFSQQDGLTGDYVHCVLEDREGNMWFGTSGGLDRFRQSPVVSISLQPIAYPGARPIPALHSFTTSALAPGDQGELWAAGIGPQVLLRIQDDRAVTQLRDRPVDCAYRDPNGDLWFATPSAIFRIAHEHPTTASIRGAVSYNYRGSVPAGPGLTLSELILPKAGGITISPHSRVRAITQDRWGRLWISMDSGTFRMGSSGWTSLASLGGPPGTATAEFTDSDGRVWFGFANSVAMLDGDKLHMFSGDDGVQIGAVTSIQANGTKVWIGGEFGLEFLDGARFQTVTPSDGSTFDGVSGIVAESGEGLWFSDNRGIIHIPEGQFRQLSFGKVDFESFGLREGLTAELRGLLASPSAVRTTDGRIWFATTKGVAWINPKRIARNMVPPPVSIVAISSANHPQPVSNAIRFAAGTQSVEIDYTALSLTEPQRIEFRYKLDGVDPDWRDAGNRREADYSNLGPGQYRFRVIACNNDGVWNVTGASLDFSIAPAYYQTQWFRAACLAIFIALIWMGYRVRGYIVEQRFLERSRADEALRRARAEIAHISRVNTLGELTASLAHEIKQPIGAAVTNAEACLLFLDRDQPDLPEAREAALEMTKDARRAADIIERVRSLYRKGSSQREIVDTNEIIREMVMMLDNEAHRHSVTIATNLENELPKVIADRVQLQQVLMNLMLNGIEAMRDTRGELTIKSELREKSEVLISVSDTGVGLPAGREDQIFDAFFTTKSQGTGLGLAITRSIIESHGGHVWATANAGPGARFQFTVPVAEAAGK